MTSSIISKKGEARTVQAVELIALLGKSTEDSEVMKILESLNLKKQPQAKYDNPRADVEVKKQGWGMAFRDEDYLLHRDIGFKGFKGELMKGVRLSDTRSEILHKLGNPHAKYESNGILRNEIWNFDEYRLAIIYTPEGKVKDAQVISLKYE
jgi:hypothetical protein